MRIRAGDRIHVYVPKWASGEHIVTVQSDDSGQLVLVPSTSEVPGSPCGLLLTRLKKSKE